MSDYIVPIQTAFAIFPLLAALFTIPYMIVQYHKYGSLPVLRVLIVYSFILYLTSIYFLIILPLPTIESVEKMTSPTMQLIPFQFITDFIKQTSLVITDPSTYLKAIKEPWFYQVIYNVLLLVPFGIYLRYYFKCSLKKTVCLSFLLSLFFESTQLSGLYGIYPRGYRLFDVDDLFTNTLGGLLGYFLTPLLGLFLPSKDKLDHISYQKGAEVSYTRRMLALGIDLVIFSVLNLTGTIAYFIYAQRRISFSSPISFIVIEVLTWIFYLVISLSIGKGQTLGKKIVNIRLALEEGKTPKWYHYLTRYFSLYGVVTIVPLVSLMMLLSGFIDDAKVFILGGILSLISGIYLFKLFLSILTKRKTLFYEKWSKTHHMSTILIPTEEEIGTNSQRL